MGIHVVILIFFDAGSCFLRADSVIL